jgi:hypothetical protein
MDKATIVSVFPKEINEEKVTIFPSKFHIPAGTYKEPAVVVVGPSSWWRDIDPDQPMLEIPVSAVQIAQSVIVDYCNGMLGCDMSTAMPGMFFIPGEYEKKDVVDRYKAQLGEAKIKQDNWYKTLIKLADALWARTNGNPLVIWDEMRLAARELGLDKIWIRDYQNVEMVKCFACGSLRNPEFPICPVCKNVDQSHPRAKDIKTAVS